MHANLDDFEGFALGFEPGGKGFFVSGRHASGVRSRVPAEVLLDRSGQHRRRERRVQDRDFDARKARFRSDRGGGWHRDLRGGVRDAGQVFRVCEELRPVSDRKEVPGQRLVKNEFRIDAGPSWTNEDHALADALLTRLKPEIGVRPDSRGGTGER